MEYSRLMFVWLKGLAALVIVVCFVLVRSIIKFKCQNSPFRLYHIFVILLQVGVSSPGLILDKALYFPVTFIHLINSGDTKTELL